MELYTTGEFFITCYLFHTNENIILKLRILFIFLICRPNKVSKVPQAMRFFYSDSVVTDWYRGQLSSALAAINTEDISFVMYYAPWDAESQYVRGEFEKAANILQDRVRLITLFYLI